MSYKYNKLRGRIIEKYSSQKEFSKAVGISANILSQKMNGKVGFSQEDIIKWSSLLEIGRAEIGSYFFA